MILSICALILISVTELTSAGPPIITTEMVNVTTEVGARAQFYCEAMGEPTPNINIVKVTPHMTRLNITVPNDEEATPNGDEVSALQVLNNVDQGDEGWWECSASNSFGRVSARAYLHISETALCKDVKCPFRKHCHADYVTMTTECRCTPCEHDNYDPVCGTDCNTYVNPCHLRFHSCTHNLGLGIEHKGQCDVLPAVLSVPGPRIQVTAGDTLTLTCQTEGYPSAKGVRWGKIMRNGRLRIVGQGPVYEVSSLSESKTPGTYRCVAQQCRNRLKSEEVEVEVVEKGVEDLILGMKTCDVFGDPHFITFDGQSYDFMGRCNYIMAVDCFASKWMIVGQFMPCGNGVTCLEQLTVYHGTMRPLTITRGWIVAQDQEKYRLKNRQPMPIGEVVVTFSGLSMIVDFPTGVQLVWDGFWGAQIRVPVGQVTCGLCGDNNGDPANDLDMGRYGATEGEVGYFGQSWAMWNAQWCGLEAPDIGNVTCATDQATVEDRCDAILNSDIFSECVNVIDRQFLRNSCIMDGCKAVVQRYEGSAICAFTNSLSQMCEVRGYGVPGNFLELTGCGSKRRFQEDVYNAGCPLTGDPPFLES